MRDVCSTKLLQASIILGGPDTIVQINESLFTLNQVQNLFEHLSFIFFRMVVAVHQLKNNGYLGWWTHPQDLL